MKFRKIVFRDILPLSLCEECEARPFADNMNPSLEVIMRLFTVWIVDLETWQCVLKKLAASAEVHMLLQQKQPKGFEAELPVSTAPFREWYG